MPSYFLHSTTIFDFRDSSSILLFRKEIEQKTGSIELLEDLTIYNEAQIDRSTVAILDRGGVDGFFFLDFLADGGSTGGDQLHLQSVP